jgi:hypothetical protein
VKPASAKLVLLRLADAHNAKTGNCFPSVASVARRSGLDRKSVLSGLKRLESLGLIIVRKKHGASNSYALQTSTDIGTSSARPEQRLASTKNGTGTKSGTSTENGTPPVPKTVLGPVPKTGHKPGIEPGSNQKHYAFSGERIRITDADFETMAAQYPNLDLMAQLSQLDLELREEKKWWPVLQAKLNYRNRNHENTQRSHGPGADQRGLSEVERVRERRRQAAERQA